MVQMGWRPRPKKWPWRDFLRSEERAEVARLDDTIERARREMAEASARLIPIRQRAMMRAKNDAAKREDS